MIISLATVLTPTDTLANLSRRVTVGDLARYLSQVEANVNSPTLELATLLGFGERLGDLNLDGGDRLVLCVRAGQRTTLTTPPQTGDILLTLEEGDYRVRSQGKQGLLVGIPDHGRSTPDVDLRRIVAPNTREYISRSTLWFSYAERQWYVARTGQTRVRLDELELEGERVPVDHGQRLTFYRASDDPHHVPALGGLTIWLETVTKTDQIPPLETGPEQTPLRTGLEIFQQRLRVSEHIVLDHLVNRLSGYNKTPLTPDSALYQLRLIAPSTRIAALDLKDGQFLYAPYTAPPAGLTLQLRDAVTFTQAYTLLPNQQEALMGCRLQPNERIPTLDIDLYELFFKRNAAPHQLGIRTPFLARLVYRAAENAWWIIPVDRLPIGLFVNTTRVNNNGLPLANGDILTLGESVSRDYVQLEVTTSTELR